MKIQAGRARSHQELSTRLRELQLNYALAEYHKLQGRFMEVAEQLEQAERTTPSPHGNSPNTNSNWPTTKSSGSPSSSNSKTRTGSPAAKSRQEQAEQRKQFAKNSLADLQRQIERDSKRLDELTARSAQLETELTEQSAEVTRLAASHGATQQQLETAQNKYRQAQHELNESAQPSKTRRPASSRSCAALRS